MNHRTPRCPGCPLLCPVAQAPTGVCLLFPQESSLLAHPWGGPWCCPALRGALSPGGRSCPRDFRPPELLDETWAALASARPSCLFLASGTHRGSSCPEGSRASARVRGGDGTQELWPKSASPPAACDRRLDRRLRGVGTCISSGERGPRSEEPSGVWGWGWQPGDWGWMRTKFRKGGAGVLVPGYLRDAGPRTPWAPRPEDAHVLTQNGAASARDPPLLLPPGGDLERPWHTSAV